MECFLPPRQKTPRNSFVRNTLGVKCFVFLFTRWKLGCCFGGGGIRIPKYSSSSSFFMFLFYFKKSNILKNEWVFLLFIWSKLRLLYPMRNPFLGGFGIGVILTSTPAIQICSVWTDHPADWGTCISHFCHETGSAGVGAGVGGGRCLWKSIID